MKHIFLQRVSLLVLAFAFTGIGCVQAQTFVGGVRGQVQDPAGAVIANAKVTLANQATDVMRSSVSNSDGEYAFSLVEPGTYSLTVERPDSRNPSKADWWFQRKGS